MKFQSNCNCNRLHLHVIDPNSDKRQIIATCANVIRLLFVSENFKLTLGKKRCEWECNKTIISETFCVFSLVRTSGYHLKVCVFKLNIKFTFVRRKTLTSVLRQNEQHEQVEIMANHGPLCKRINNNKENILK